MPDEKMKQTTFRLSETDHQCLKILAAKERKTIQELVLEALDKVFPHWRNLNKKTAVWWSRPNSGATLTPMQR